MHSNPIASWFLLLFYKGALAKRRHDIDVSVLHVGQDQDARVATASSEELAELLRKACPSGEMGMTAAYPLLLETLGQGGFGQVFLREDRNGTAWAVKHIHVGPGRTINANELTLLLQRAPFNSALREVFVQWYGDEARDLYVVTPWYSGGDLDHWYGAKRWTTRPGSETIRDIMAQLAYGLWELHKRGMMHADVKLGNAMLSTGHTDGRVVLIDYGLAKIGCPTDGNSPCTKACAGTEAYMAPAICKTAYSFEVDFWSWGILATELLEGAPLIRVLISPTGRSYNFEPFEKWSQGESDVLWASMLRMIFDLDDTKAAQRLGDRRQDFTSPWPDEHPVLGHPLWLLGRDLPDEAYMPEDYFSWLKRLAWQAERSLEELDPESWWYKAEIRKFWAEVCKQYASPESRVKCYEEGDYEPRGTGATVVDMCISDEV